MSGRPSAGLLRPALLALAAAILGNLLLLGIANGIGADLIVTDWSGSRTQVGAATVTIATLVPMLAGLALAAAVNRHRRLLITLAGLAAVVTVVSLYSPLSLDSGAATRFMLAAMHLVAGAAYLSVVVGWIRRSSREAAGSSAPATI